MKYFAGIDLASGTTGIQLRPDTRTRFEPHSEPCHGEASTGCRAPELRMFHLLPAPGDKTDLGRSTAETARASPLSSSATSAVRQRLFSTRYLGQLEDHAAAVSYDPADPPLYESQASYLLRHDLLLPGERRRLTEGDLDPEAIVLDQPDLLY